MRASSHIGRVGGLAVVLGVGAAILTTCGIASAGPGSSDSSRPSTSASATGSTARSGSAHAAKRPSARTQTPEGSASGAASTSPGSVESAAPSLKTVDKQPPSTTFNRSSLGTLRGQRAQPGSTTVITSSAASLPVDNGVALAALSSVTTASALSTVSPLPTTQSVRVVPSQKIATTAIPPGVLSLVLTSVAELALAVTVSITNAIVPSPTRASPTLSINGYDLVPSSTEKVTSFYGQWTYLPGAPSLVQGEQQFDVVDPSTSTTVGTFDALVGRGDGYNYTELLVTSNDGTNVGTRAGEVPPVGSLIASFTAGPIGWSYSAMPSTSGDVVSFKLLTPFGDVPIPMPFDGAKGIADHTVDNRPVQLADGYSIAPADPTAETFTATDGILPFFTAVQGRQVFNIYNSAGYSVGSFEGVFTTTSDIIHTYTQAILVTSNDGTNVGTSAGQVPPVGSVYNVVYGGSDQNYVLYSSLPSLSGDVVSVTQVTPDGVSNSSRTFIDASTPPSTQSLTAPDGHSFVPTSPLQPAGVNGLPPREVQIQGYQQFDVYDTADNRLGSLDADVSTQWDVFGIRSEALLVTNVTQGTVGTTGGDVPPVGSVFNFVYFGNSGFGTCQSVMPLPSGDVSSFKILTPVGDTPLFSIYTPVEDRTDVSFFDPFATV
jgi:hypothetical protein